MIIHSLTKLTKLIKQTKVLLILVASQYQERREESHLIARNKTVFLIHHKPSITIKYYA